MKVKLDTVGFTEGKKLNIAHNLISVGIVVTSVGVLTTLAGRIISTRTSSWMKVDNDPILKKQAGLIFDSINDLAEMNYKGRA